MNRSFKTGLAVLGAAALFAVGGTSTAVAAKLIHGDDIAPQTVTSRNLAPNSVGKSEVKDNVWDRLSKDGKDGVDGKDGKDGVSGLEYRTFDYIAGGARPGHDGYDETYNGAGSGGIATAACSSEDKVAIAGGAQFLGLKNLEDNGTQSVTEGWNVVDSFPGRMDWSATPAVPKADRLDGWIVRLNAPAGAHPVDMTVWAICVDKTAAVS